MKKLLTLCAAVLASVSMWAADPTLAIGTTAQTSSTFLGTYTEQGITLSSTSNYSSGAVQLGNTPSAYDAHYFEVLSSSDIIDSISFLISGNGSNKSIQAPVFAWENTATGNTADTYAILDAVTVTANSYAAAKWFTYDLTAVDVKCARIYRTTKGISSINPEYTGSSTALGSGQTIKIYGIKVYTHANCNDPEAVLTLSKTAMFVDEEADLSFTTNGTGVWTSEVTLNGETAEYGTDYNMTGDPFSLPLAVKVIPLKAGTFEITMTQEAWDGYCAVEEKVTAEVSAANPVSAVTIGGPTTGVIGQSLTYTADDANATDYEWYLDGDKQGSDSAKFIYTGVKGNHTIYCNARNQFNKDGEGNATWVKSNEIALTVTKVCGELIKATLNGGTNADMSGVVGGTFDTNLGSGKYKLDKGKYIGVKLASGTFQAGDVVTIEMSAAGQNYPCLFGDKDRETVLFLATEASTATSYEITLPDAANGLTSVYLSRESTDEGATYKWNPTVSSISVSRSCEDSNDASIHSLTVNGEEVAKDAEANKYEYTVSASYEEATVEVAFGIHPLATASIASPFNINVPEAGADANGQAITVTAEDGTQVTYTVFVSKSASLSNDATLQALAVEGYTLSPAFDPAVTAYTITKAYEDELPAISAVSATLNDANATLLGISYNETKTNEIDIQIMAEDGETAGTYTITVNSEEAKKDLSRVLFSNGFDAFIDNTAHTVKAFYLAGTEAPTASTITAGNGTAGELAEDKIVVTGADNSIVEYAVTLEAVTPNTTTVAEEAAAGAFDGTEDWVKSGLYMSNAAGFATDKYVLRRGLRGSDAATDQRVIAGWVRAYFFVGNASKFEMAVSGNKPLKYAVDGGDYTEVNADNISIALGAGNHMIEIVTNQTNGDCNLSAPKLVERASDPTALDNAEAGMKAVKRIVDGQLLIEKNGVLYNAQGAVVK